MTALLLDTHVVYHWTTEPERLPDRATRALDAADELVVSAVTWWELAWLIHHRRLEIRRPLQGWLHELSTGLRTAPLTPAVATTAVELPETFPHDPFDRLIFATAIENDLVLVTADGAMRAHGGAGRIIW